MAYKDGGFACSVCNEFPTVENGRVMICQRIIKPGGKFTNPDPHSSHNIYVCSRCLESPIPVRIRCCVNGCTTELSYRDVHVTCEGHWYNNPSIVARYSAHLEYNGASLNPFVAICATHQRHCESCDKMLCIECYVQHLCRCGDCSRFGEFRCDMCGSYRHKVLPIVVHNLEDPTQCHPDIVNVCCECDANDEKTKALRARQLSLPLQIANRYRLDAEDRIKRTKNRTIRDMFRHATLEHNDRSSSSSVLWDTTFMHHRHPHTHYTCYCGDVICFTELKKRAAQRQQENRGGYSSRLAEWTQCQNVQCLNTLSSSLSSPSTTSRTDNPFHVPIHRLYTGIFQDTEVLSSSCVECINTSSVLTSSPINMCCQCWFRISPQPLTIRVDSITLAVAAAAAADINVAHVAGAGAKIPTTPVETTTIQNKKTQKFISFLAPHMSLIHNMTRLPWSLILNIVREYVGCTDTLSRVRQNGLARLETLLHVRNIATHDMTIASFRRMVVSNRLIWTEEKSLYRKIYNNVYLKPLDADSTSTVSSWYHECIVKEESNQEAIDRSSALLLEHQVAFDHLLQPAVFAAFELEWGNYSLSLNDILRRHANDHVQYALDVSQLTAQRIAHASCSDYPMLSISTATRCEYDVGYETHCGTLHCRRHCLFVYSTKNCRRHEPQLHKQYGH